MAQPFTFGSSSNPLGTHGQLLQQTTVNMSPAEISTWARDEYRREYCDDGKQVKPIDLRNFLRDLQDRRPGDRKTIENMCDELDLKISAAICKRFAIDDNGCFKSQVDVVVTLHELRPDLAENMMVSTVVELIEKKNREAKPNQTPKQPLLPTIDSQSVQRSIELAGSSGTLLRQSPSSAPPTCKPMSTKDATDVFVMAQLQCDKHKWTEATQTQVQEEIVSVLSPKFPHVYEQQIRELVKEAQAIRQARAAKSAANQAITPSKPRTTSVSQALSQPPVPPMSTTSGSSALTFEAWVHQQYLAHGFGPNGSFQGYPWLKTHLQNLRPKEGAQIKITVNSLRKSGHQYSFNLDRDKTQILKARKNLQSASAQLVPRTVQPHNCPQRTFTSHPATLPQAGAMCDAYSPGSMITPMPNDASAATIDQIDLAMLPKDDLLARKLNQLHGSSGAANEDETRSDEELTLHNSPTSSNTIMLPKGDLMSSLLSDESDDEEGGVVGEADKEIRHAPLLSAAIISENDHSLVPQYGLVGSYEKERLFLNTNVPFSAFICGVQGSGKSHTTATVLENALIPSKQLGRLKSPLSALVFSYGQFGGDGSGFSISEAAFLAAPHPKFPGHPHVKRIHVLVSPSNYVKIAKLYLRVPNVVVTKFKLKPRNLDIDIMLTLMNVSESDDTPLYMAAVTQLLRQMATEGGPFNYFDFRARLRKCRFNPVQVNMLQMRLGLLESFLDLDNSCTEPQFKEQEVTIMDMSCPFVDANTACILFRIGLQRYLQSKAAGKMIVLDEAHKYMLPNPGAKALNETLVTTIRLQRHYGARVVISTQEPTLLTDLIALCSITVIHRFSSPEWFAAIKRHIPMRPEEHHVAMQAIEGLKTGTALVYSPNAALGRNEEGQLVKGTGKLMKVNVRKRVTSDGGQSVLAV